MNEPERAMLLSVHPRFATAILAGDKTVEVRRQRVAAPPGTAVLLYATAPTKAIVGMARIASVHVATPTEVWSASRNRAGISRREYDTYMDGAVQASGLTLEAPITFGTPVPLTALRAAGAFHPPQSYRYLRPEDLRRMTAAATSTDAPLRTALESMAL
ncbi:ASCH domain-containing protein [Streptomyces sp. H27-C3]|uniref:ASCH domain-containing protein n=1 Tax=Streptomyces sp. H27-C3 TaxID=3046305 RepID=UPI0024B92A77|nr:ASCH domain-containing protein [Streptomyces sp. H27-C3]MDJ0466854.1 ASCH domain-containing protein [Streptomyces sp. H27-C3]